MADKFDPDQLAKRLQALKKKQTAVKKQRAEEDKRIKLAASITMTPSAMADLGYLPPPEDHPVKKSNALLRKQRQRMNRHRGKLAVEALVWFFLAVLSGWWCYHQLTVNGQP